MAFGRSNSLSINTGATNSLFNTQQQNTNAQPQQTSSLFGNSTNTAGPSAPAGGSLFGANTQPQQQQQQQSGSLFGGTLGQAQNAGQNTGGGLFGGLGQTQTQSNTGNSTFGGFGNTQTQQQPAGSLFGGFGQQNSQQPQGGGLFGNAGSTQAAPAGTSLFANSTQTSQAAQQPSLLSASIFNSTTQAPLAGSLIMGQSTTSPATVPGVKIDLSNLRPTTRFSDIHDDLKAQIESLDAFIRQQESFASQCEAMLPSHAESVSSLRPDVALIETKADTVELGLENDGGDIAAAKELLRGDVRDLFRCVRVIENQALPARFHYGPTAGSSGGSGGDGAKSGSSVGGGAGVVTVVAEDEYDVDLLGYFTRQVDSMGRTKGVFDGNLAEIEAHLGTIERRTQAMIEGVQREKHTGRAEAKDTVRELAGTLRGFEEGILDAARKVGGVREGVEGLVDARRRRY